MIELKLTFKYWMQMMHIYTIVKRFLFFILFSLMFCVLFVQQKIEASENHADHSEGTTGGEGDLSKCMTQLGATNRIIQTNSNETNHMNHEELATSNPGHGTNNNQTSTQKVEDSSYENSTPAVDHSKHQLK